MMTMVLMILIFLTITMVASMHTIYGDDLVLNFESKDQYFVVFFDLFIIPW